MVSIAASGIQTGRDNSAAALSAAEGSKSAADKASVVQAPAGASAVADAVVISTLAGRLSKAATATSAAIEGLDRKALGAWLKDNVSAMSQALGDGAAAAAKQQPQPNDAASARSAAAATDFVNNKGPNPFAGLSREQLATITHDDSGTFTVNERRAASSQANREEYAWRSQVVAQAMHEYNTSGKMTNFFKSVLGHYNALPQLEQAQYPENYASDLEDKIKLDFNYFNHAAGDGGPTPGSLADMANKQGANQGAQLFDLLLRS